MEMFNPLHSGTILLEIKTFKSIKDIDKAMA